jgi:transmembrane protein 231
MYLSLYHEHYGVRYAPRGLAAWLFYVICLLTILVIPFIIGLAMQNFWVETNYFYQMPQVTFTERCALRVSTVLGKEYLWTCSEVFNDALLGTSLSLTPYFAVYEEDKDGDGKADVVNFLLSFPLGNASDGSVYNASAGGVTAPATARDAVIDVVFLPEFVYNIKHYLVKVNMTAAPLLRYTRLPLQRTAGTPITTSVDVDDSSRASLVSSTYAWSSAPVCALTKADMLFHSTESLINSPYVSYQHTYTASPLAELARQPADLINLLQFAGAYTSRNQSVVLRPYVEAFGGLDVLRHDNTVVRGLWDDLEELNAFTWYIQLRIPKAEVQYVPSYAEVLKWGWIQYFVIGYIIQWFLWKVRMIFVKMGLISSRATFSLMRRQY